MEYRDIENEVQTSKRNNIKYIIIIGILSFLLLALLISNIIFILKYKNAQKNNESESFYKPKEEQYIEILDNMDEEDDEGAKEYQGKFDILNSKYYKSLDIYNMKSSGSLILLEKFKTYQQTTSYTCGCAALIMAINYIDNKVISEKECANKAHTIPGNGTMPYNLEKAIEDFGYDYESKRRGFNSKEDIPSYDEKKFSEYIKNTLKKNLPIVILSNDWAGHYTVIIGYDDMGNDNMADDVLIIADPFDTTDHICDGYTIWSFERLYYQMKVPYLEKENSLEFFTVKKK
jgi:predicted double-glycine peptidase